MTLSLYDNEIFRFIRKVMIILYIYCILPLFLAHCAPEKPSIKEKEIGKSNFFPDQALYIDPSMVVLMAGTPIEYCYKEFCYQILMDIIFLNSLSERRTIEFFASQKCISRLKCSSVGTLGKRKSSYTMSYILRVKKQRSNIG